MRMLLSTFLFSLALVASLGLGEANAYTGIKNNWLSTYPDICSELQTLADDCLICHTNPPSYSELNPYALDYLANGEDWSNIESMDSDGDSRTNIEEILIDCTNPGDEVSTGNNDETWAMIKALYDD